MVSVVTFGNSVQCISLTPSVDLFTRVNKDLGAKLQQRTEAAIKGV